ncbi:phage portal protein [Pseudokineococcus lusitanus]|uniref:SPP1 Gp6-like portal protein n=1 Tax=Pseudokineococcus lusitanus TaxID=763993 RepID=A0A3N1HTS9_9ACTN|nr:phage portal protein [Pseudokineococcus lusitanus]ROP45938.1 SPP1 Gp6-like portal protein [Pseudokineococcus lusitanus]
MPLSADETRDNLNALTGRLGREKSVLTRLDAYYEGTQRLEQMGIAVPPQLARFTTMVNWPRVTADSLNQRCGVRGFRLPGQTGTDGDLADVWQANDLDEESQQAHLDALVFGRSYAAVGTRHPDEPDADLPLVTVESPLCMTHDVDPRTRRVTRALRKVRSGDVELATLYLPDETIWLERSPRTRGWEEKDRDDHQLGVVPVVPLVNRPRLGNRYGVSEIADVISLTDAACRALTDAQLATEALAVPQKYVLGAAEKDFVDPQGRPVTKWESYFGAVWTLMNEKATVGSFPAADLKNFETIVNHYANLVSGVSGLPTRFYGQYTTNPPSEGSIVADETRLIQNAYRVHVQAGGFWESVMRLCMRLVYGEWDPDLKRMETLWRSPETPTRAQQADAVQKLATTVINGVPLVPLEMARESLGWSEADLARARELDDSGLERDPVMRATRALRDTTTAPAGDQPAVTA